MPKIKTHKGAKRRFHITGTGKVMHRKRNISHLRMRMSKAAKGKISAKVMAHDAMQARVHKLLPYD